MKSLSNIMRAKKSGGTDYTRRKLVFIDGTSVTITVAEDTPSGEVRVTVAASVGTSFPGYYGSAPPGNSGVGSAGSSGLVSRGDHYHPAIATMLRSAYNYINNSSVSQVDVSTGWTPYLWLADLYASASNLIQFGIAVGASSYSYSAHQWDNGGSSGAVIAYPMEAGGGNWSVSEWSTTRVRVAGSAEVLQTAGFFVLGSI